MPNNYDAYVNMLNAIRNEASARFSNAIPAADGTEENLRTIGAQLTSNKAFANEWLDALYNRIAITRVITMDGWKNPLREFKHINTAFIPAKPTFYRNRNINRLNNSRNNIARQFRSTHQSAPVAGIAQAGGLRSARTLSRTAQDCQSGGLCRLLSHQFHSACCSAACQ